MGCNIAKMCASAKPNPNFNHLEALATALQRQRLRQQYRINSTQKDLAVSTLHCVCRMENHPCISFFVIARGKSSDDITGNGPGTQDLSAIS